MDGRKLLHKILSPKNLKVRRLEICNMCPHYTGTRCKVCGCFVTLKSSLKNAKCPNGYWDQKLLEQAIFGEIDDKFDDPDCCGS